VYNAALKDALELEKQGKVLIVAPDTIGHMSTLSKEKQNLYLLYRKGYNDAEKIARFIRGE
jgi:predicted patatin/cPLA2 family phospholipase